MDGIAAPGKGWRRDVWALWGDQMGAINVRMLASMPAASRPSS